jgi:ATP-dependent exoDNAse (exonuclease V) beta subunit
VDEAALRPMLDVARLALRARDVLQPGARSTEHDDLLRGALISPAGGLDPYQVRALVRAARLSGRALGAVVADPGEDIPEDVRAKLRAFTSLVAETRDRVDSQERPDATFWFLWESLDYFRDLVADENADELDAVAAFARAIARFSEKRPGKTFGDYLDVLEGVEFGPEPWHMPEERRPDAVRVMTAHNAAGAEFEAVVVAGCVEGEFPDPHERRLLFDVRDLLAPGTPFERAAARLDEETRLFRVAATRARSHLVLTAAQEWSRGRAENASALVSLAGLEWARPPADAEPLTRDDAEAAARRALRAGTADEKRAAIGVLARLPGVDPDSWWYERDWTDPGAPLADGELRTSYSRLNAYDNCALQYLYQVELGLDPASTHQMLVGTWVHGIVERVDKKEIEATEAAMIEALDAVWDERVFESVAIAHRRRIDAEEMLRRWLKVDGKLDTKATEVAFEFDIEGATIRGRIDRIVRLGTSMVRLIDYKTGRSAKREAEAREDLQLATYYLALTNVPELQQLGTPKILELAYLGAFTRDGGFMRASVDPTKDPDYGAHARARLEGFVRGIRAEEFAPTASANCQWCRFKTLCPLWPEGDEVRL